jgi:F0F1-type ATP synthase membrane subunit a
MSTSGVVAPKGVSSFLSMPTTVLGRWSAWLLVLSIVLVLVFNLVVLPAALPEMAENAVGLTLFTCFLASGVTGFLAIVMKHERSWVAFLATVLFLAVLAMNLGPILFE